MRKLALGLSLLCLSAGLLHPASADPGAATFHDQFAFADWIELHGNSGTLTGAVGARFIDEDSGLVTVGAVFKGKCHVDKGRNFTFISCSGSGKGRDIPLQDFQMHPLMDTASLDVRVKGFDNHVDWTGRGPGPVASGGAAVGGDWVAAGTDIYRDAKSSGKVLGDKVKSAGWLDWAMMFTGVQAVGFTGLDDLENIDAEGLDIDVTPGGKITVNRTYRIPN